MPEKIVHDQTQDEALKPKKKEKLVRADEPLHAEKAGEEKSVKDAREHKINKYGFLHIDKKLAAHLGVEFGKDKENMPVDVELIDGGFVVRVKA